MILGVPMRRLRLTSQGKSVVGLCLLVLAELTSASAFCSRGGVAEAESMAAVWRDLRGAKPTVRGSLRLDTCGWSSTPSCGAYLIQALEYHWKDLRPNELEVTDLRRHRVIFADRDVDFFLYMFPLAPDSVPSSAGLLATVWGTGTTNGVVRVYLLEGDSVKVVFYRGSRFTPQFLAANESRTNPVILLYRYSGGVGAMIPTDTEIWQWSPGTEKFVLRATVPVGQRFEALAKLEHESTVMK